MSVMRSSLLGSLLQVLKFNLDRKAERVRVFELGRVFVRDASVQTTDTTVRGVRQPMKVAGLAYGEPDGLQWGRKAGADFYDEGRRRRRCWRRCRPSSAAEHPAMHPGRCAASASTAARSASSASCTRAGASSGNCRTRRCCSSWTSTPWRRARCPPFEPVPRFQPAERDLAVIVADQRDARRCWPRSAPPTPAAAARRVAVRRLQAQASHGRHGGRTRKAWPCA
jgi:phenylalanyl-tRNA synthetase beta chain